MRNRAKDSEICVQCRKDFLKKTDIAKPNPAANKPEKIDKMEKVEAEKDEAEEKAQALARLEEERQAILKKRREE